MLKEAASVVLASFRPSTYRLRFSEAEVLEGFIRSPESIVRANGPTKCGGCLFRSSLAAALHAERRILVRRGWVGENSGSFEHPAGKGSGTCSGIALTH